MRITMAATTFYQLYLLLFPVVVLLVVANTSAAAAAAFSRGGTFILTRTRRPISPRQSFSYYRGRSSSRPSLVVRLSSSASANDDDDDDDDTDAQQQQQRQLKDQILSLSEQTSRGFQATRDQREKIRHLIYELSTYYDDPNDEPAKFYYDQSSLLSSDNAAYGNFPKTTLCGKWTLIYTDAPDITGLDTSKNPFAPAELGRIGQECQPPYIKNVIEWKRPSWASNLPLLAGDDDDNVRIFQKVVVEASATPEKPKLVKLELSGLQIETDNDDEDNNGSSSSGDSSSWQDTIRKKGLVAGLLSNANKGSGSSIDLTGPINVPFGEFVVLYLDKDLRAIKTGQNYLAVNVRCNNNNNGNNNNNNEVWF